MRGELKTMGCIMHVASDMDIIFRSVQSSIGDSSGSVPAFSPVNAEERWLFASAATWAAGAELGSSLTRPSHTRSPSCSTCAATVNCASHEASSSQSSMCACMSRETKTTILVL